jgi:hypothetical protein
MLPGVTEMSSTGCDVTPCKADSVALLSGLLPSPGRLKVCKTGFWFACDCSECVWMRVMGLMHTQQQLLLAPRLLSSHPTHLPELTDAICCQSPRLLVLNAGSTHQLLFVLQGDQLPTTKLIRSLPADD